MERFLGKYSAYIYAVLRIVTGAMFAMHGSQKLFGSPGGKAPAQLASLMGVAGAIEFFGGLLIAVGLFGGFAAFIASGQMAVAFFKSHFPDGWLPILNHGELAVLYCFIFLYIASQGSGVCSVDSLVRRTKRSPSVVH